MSDPLEFAWSVVKWWMIVTIVIFVVIPTWLAACCIKAIGERMRGAWRWCAGRLDAHP
ncbi:MAG: hypothetical protein KF841_15165 [Phycisphaerae bacterium]|nr:hypothetical protein [Phycisphaerae bacterium]